MSDAELLHAIGRSDMAAFGVLLDRYLEHVQMLARRMLGDAGEAEDLAQEVFLKIWKNPDRWQPGRAQFKTWLSRVAANACIDNLRRKKPDELEGEDEPVDPAPGPYDETLNSQLAKRVEAALQNLPARQRLAITLCHYQGYSNKEGANIMQTSSEAIESLLSRARRSLKAMLADDMKALLHDK